MIIEIYTDAEGAEIERLARRAEETAEAANARRVYDVASEEYADAARLYRALAQKQDDLQDGWGSFAGEYRRLADIYDRLSELAWSDWVYRSSRMKGEKK